MPVYHYHRIDDLERHHKLNDMVFGAIWCGESNPSQHYLDLTKKQRGKNIPFVLMHMRWDGHIGFPGGGMEYGESLEEALVREMKEEYNFDVGQRAEFLCSHADDHGELHTHCFEIRVSEPELRETIENATRGEHFLAETQGVFAVQVAEFPPNRGYCQVRKNNFMGSSGLQLDALVKRHGWLPLR